MENNDNQYNDYQQPPKAPQTPAPPQNPMALASMITGIFGLLACCAPPLQFILGMISLLLAIFSKKEKPFSGFAIAGLIIAILCLVISVGMVLAVIWASEQMKNPEYAALYREILQMYQEILEGANQ